MKQVTALRTLGLTTMIALLALSGAQRAAAQAVKGTLLGTVADSQGAAIPGATVTVTETSTTSREAP